MCGRLVLSYSPNKICQFCIYKQNKDIIVMPEWIDLFKERIFKPSYNMCPKMLCPVIILNNHLSDENKINTKKRVIVPMQWGLIPNWYKGDLNQFKLHTINCRCETLDTKPSFRNSIKNGRRCVILAQGFFEWTKGTHKQPYYIHSNALDENNPNFDKLIKIAGIFDTCKKDEELVYTFSIITIDSKNSSINWIHDRVPLILETEDEINEWLNYDEYSFEEAKELFKPAKSIIYHAVSDVINNPLHDTAENITEIRDFNTSMIQPSINIFIEKPRSRSRSPI